PANGDPLGRLAVEWSHPRWLVARWADEFGPEALPALLAANNERAPTALRANRAVTTRDALQAELAAEGLSTTAGAWAPGGLLVERGAARLRALRAWQEGRFAFQGEPSQLIAPLLGLEPGMRVLDACAAPGGKTAHVAELLGAEAFVLALDRRLSGLRRVLVETTRLGARTGVAAARGSARRRKGVPPDPAPPPRPGRLLRRPAARAELNPGDSPWNRGRPSVTRRSCPRSRPPSCRPTSAGSRTRCERPPPPAPTGSTSTSWTDTSCRRSPSGQRWSRRCAAPRRCPSMCTS